MGGSLHQAGTAGLTKGKAGEQTGEQNNISENQAFINQ